MRALRVRQLRLWDLQLRWLPVHQLRLRQLGLGQLWVRGLLRVREPGSTASQVGRT